MRCLTLALGLSLAAAAGLPAGNASLERYEFSQLLMGTRARIIVYAPDETTASRAGEAAFERVRALDNIMSDYRANSELMRLSAGAGGPPQPVSDDLFRVLEISEALARRSGGAFDVTVGPIVRLWREARQRHELPSQERLAEARRLVGYQKIRLDSKSHRVQLLEPGMQLDLGAIGKGYAADAALAVLRERGLSRALVAMGGDIAVGDAPPGQKGWRIAIAPFDSAEKEPTQFLELHNAGISTSGDAEQFVEIAGRRYSHVVDPRTGMALEGHRQDTIVAPNATTSDGLATAVCVLGREQGLKLVKSTPGCGIFYEQSTPHGVERLTWKIRLLPPAPTHVP